MASCRTQLNNISASAMVCAAYDAGASGARSAAITRSTTARPEQRPLQPPISAGSAAANTNTVKTQMIIDDEIHGAIQLPSHIQEIVLHPLFQRLKKVQQLGFSTIAVQPQANHKRYDHCIGTYKSAQQQLAALERNSSHAPKLPDWCRQAVEIAALLHDIGHGPFSHVWEHVCGGAFNHEQNALACIDRIFTTAQSVELRALSDEHKGRGVALIKALVLGRSEVLPFPMLGYAYVFDIVHNNRCGLDVDKWDYLRRDNHRLGVLSDEEMQFDELFLQARISQDGQRIEYRYEDYHRIYMLYVARWRLHLGAYQLPRVIACDDLFAAIVQRQSPDMLRVTAESEAWTELHDERVLQKIASDDQAVYLRSPELLLEVDEADAGAFRVHREIPGPGAVMLSDEHYACYGEERNKRAIERQLMPTVIDKCFKLQ